MCVFESKRFSVYPIELLSSFLSRILTVFLYTSFWLIVSKYSANPTITPKEAISYYLIASSLTPFFFLQFGVAGQLSRMINSGQLSRVLVQPINPLLYPWSERIGRNSVNLIFSAVTLIVGIVISGHLEVNPVKLVVAVLLTGMISWSLNMMLGTLAFHTTDSENVKNAFTHIARILRGDIMPIFLMPFWVQELLKFTPFPASQFYLVQAVRGVNTEWSSLGIGLLWSLLLMLFAWYFWQRSRQKYEAVGL